MLGTLNQLLPGYGAPFWNPFLDDGDPDSDKNLNISINHYMVLNLSDKIRIVARTLDGSTVEVIPETLRLRIRKKI